MDCGLRSLGSEVSFSFALIDNQQSAINKYIVLYTKFTFYYYVPYFACSFYYFDSNIRTLVESPPLRPKHNITQIR